MKNKTETPLTCPWWLLFTFDNPTRRLIHDPHKILSPYIHPGEIVLDVGCGMGYFSLELARLVGEKGQVIAADLQPEMLAGLEKRALRNGLLSQIQPHICFPDSIGIFQPIDFVLAFWVVHEVRNRKDFLREIFEGLQPGGKFMIVEPIIHVTKSNFLRTHNLCTEIGFSVFDQPRVAISRAVVYIKP